MPNKPPDATRRSERSRRAIFEAALSLVGEVGYDKLTIEGIAARAGVGKQTIYRWWSSKAEVLLDAFTADAEPAADAEPTADASTDAAAAIPDTGDLAADLKYVLRATVDEFRDHAFQAPYRALAVAGASDPELSARFVERLLEPGVQQYVTRLRAAQRAGELTDRADPRIAAEMLLSPISQRWLMRTGELSHAFTDALVDTVLAGLRPRA